MSSCSQTDISYLTFKMSLYGNSACEVIVFLPLQQQNWVRVGNNILWLSGSSLHATLHRQRNLKMKGRLRCDKEDRGDPQSLEQKGRAEKRDQTGDHENSCVIFSAMMHWFILTLIFIFQQKSDSCELHKSDQQMLSLHLKQIWFKLSYSKLKCRFCRYWDIT